MQALVIDYASCAKQCKANFAAYVNAQHLVSILACLISGDPLAHNVHTSRDGTALRTAKAQEAKHL